MQDWKLKLDVITPDQYQVACNDSKSVGEGNDCTVIALSICTEISYDAAHELLRKRGRVKGCGVRKTQWEPAFAEAGFRLAIENITAKTMKTVLEQLEKDKVYLVQSTRHVAAVVNGEILDWSKGKRKSIKAVYQVLPMGQKMTEVPAEILAKRKPVVIKRPQSGEGARIWDWCDNNIGNGWLDSYEVKWQASEASDQLGCKEKSAHTHICNWGKATGRR